MARTVKRTYNSPLRVAQAGQTRTRVLDAARVLFAEQSYPRTSIDAIATAADVSPDTIYAAFGSKREVLKQLMDRAVAGNDDATPILGQAGPRSVLREPDPRRMLARFADGVTDIIEAARPIDDILRGAAAVDVEVAALRDDVQQRQRRAAMGAVARALAAKGPLRDGISATHAATIIWALTSPEVHRLLRDQSGWSRRRYARWLGETLTRTLLPG
jgi:AcrR family transcriptional regulator